MHFFSGRIAFTKSGAGIAAVFSLLVVIGCGGDSETGTTTIHGVVTLDGKPVDQATVGFIGREGARLASTTTNQAGKFTIVTALGKNIVTVGKASANPVLPSQPQDMTMPTREEYQKIAETQKLDIPAKYSDPKTSGLSVDAAAGMKEVELALSSK